jgi:FtsX-like permease family
MMTTPRRGESVAPTSLLLAFELGQRTWKLGLSVGLGQPLRLRQIAAGAVGQLANEIARARARLGVPPDAPVISCYEAGRDGFWLHRYLRAHGIANHVVDSSSLEVNRRARRAKSDRLDLIGLMNLLARFINGDQRAWRVVRVPSLAEEDARHLPRTLETLTHERTRLINRLKGLLATQGVGRLFVRASAEDPYTLVPSITRLIRQMSADQPVERPATLEDVRAEVLAPDRLNTLVFGSFALVALTIAIVGAAGVLAFSVSARTREFGIRLAIGSAPRDLLALLREGAVIAAAGIIAGALSGIALTRVASALFGVVRMPGVVPIAGAATLLMIAAVLASLLPAARASRVDVHQALRSE